MQAKPTHDRVTLSAPGHGSGEKPVTEGAGHLPEGKSTALISRALNRKNRPDHEASHSGTLGGDKKIAFTHNEVTAIEISRHEILVNRTEVLKRSCFIIPFHRV